MCFLRLTFKTVCVVVGFLLPFSNAKGDLKINVSPGSILLGKTNVTVRCRPRWSIMRYFEEEDMNIVLDVRKDDKSGWTTISENNTSTTYVGVNESADGMTIYSIHLMDYRCYIRYFCFLVQVQFEECPNDPKIPTFRCRILSRNQTVDTSEEVPLSLKGRLPKDIGTPTNAVQERVKRGATSTFKVGEVLKLQCKGEIDNSQSRENIRWCKSGTRQNGKYEVISIQDEPVTIITSTSKDRCTIVQKSEIFYHISHEDVDLNITCELGYNTYNTKCGSGRLSGALNIRTSAKNKLDRWQISPILIYDEDNMINSQRITLEGWGKTLTLLTTASVQANNETTVERTQWCVKKGNDSAWTRINLQEDKIDAMANSTERITIFSKITYHVTVLDSSVAFLFELSPSSGCASGDFFTNLKLLISEKEDNAENIENQPSKRASTPVDNNIATTSSDAWKTWSVVTSFLLVIMASSIVLLLIVTHRRGEVSLFGFLLKTKGSGVVNVEVHSKTDRPIKREHQPKEASNEQYANSECNANRGDGQSVYLNVYKAGAPTTSQDQTYEEIRKQDNKPEEYEALKF